MGPTSFKIADNSNSLLIHRAVSMVVLAYAVLVNSDTLISYSPPRGDRYPYSVHGVRIRAIDRETSALIRQGFPMLTRHCPDSWRYRMPYSSQGRLEI